MQLAQVNVGRLKFPPSSPRVAAFIDALEPINALADQAPGFVWRFQAAEAGQVIPGGTPDPQFIVNLSVWQSYSQLHAYVYTTIHADYLRRRREWFTAMDRIVTTLWWVPDGHQPAVAEALARLESLNAHGPRPNAFSLRTRFTADGRPEPSTRAPEVGELSPGDARARGRGRDPQPD